jgi:radical SAM protein with 4Fe4S-binding SPASM domain
MKLIHPWREIYKKRHKVNYFKCFKPYDHFVITWNGDVAVCCSDYDNKSNLGNVFNDDFRKILLGKRMREFQESLKTFKVKEGICSTCKGRDNFFGNLIYENYCKILYIKNMFLSLKNK